MDNKNIPIFINNKEHLTDLKGLLDDLLCRGYTNLHIMDNGSTYEPLLEWYKDCKAQVHYYHNYGAKCLWNSNLIDAYHNEPYIVLTTSDIKLNENAPQDFIGQMISKLEKYPKYNKIGLALALDFEITSDYHQWSKDWEQQFWANVIEPDLYEAAVDDTFCVFEPGPFKYDALRIGGDFTGKHMTWYLDFNNLPEEEIYYLSHVTNESFYKGFYDKWVENKNNDTIG